MTENEKPHVKALEQKVKRLIVMSLIIFFALHSATFIWISVVSQCKPFFEYNYLLKIPVFVIQFVLMAFFIFLAWQYMKEEKRVVAITLSTVTLGVSLMPTIAVIISII